MKSVTQREMLLLSLVSVALLVFTILTMPPAYKAYANIVVDNVTIHESASSNDTEMQGTLTEGWAQTGTCEWRIDSNKHLVIRPLGNGESGALGNDHAWTGTMTKIQTVEIVGNIKAPSSLNDLFRDCAYIESITGLENIDVSNVVRMDSIFQGCSSLKTLEVSKWEVSGVMDMSHMFYACTSLLTLDVSNWNVSSVTDMRYMFYGCTSLTSLDVSKWDVSGVTDTYSMFSGCTSLSILDVSKWDVSSVTDIGHMFWGCRLLTTLDVSRWDVSGVTDMISVFEGCSSLSKLDVSGWCVSDATHLSHAFAGCASLTFLDVSRWDMSSAIFMSDMFWGCSSLTTLDVSKWDMSDVTNMRSVFRGCSSLASLNISKWDVSNVTDMVSMFYGCKSLTTLDVSSWNVSSVTDMRYMFYGCTSLTSLDVSKWDVSGIEKMTDMLKECPSIEKIKLGGNGWQQRGSEICLSDRIWISTDAKSKGPFTTYALFAKYDPAMMAGTWTVSPVSSISTNKDDISMASLHFSKTRIVYNGKPQTPGVSAKLNGKNLKNGIDYIVSYTNNVSAGTATVIVTGKGVFNGSKRATFRIDKAPQPMTIKTNAKTVRFTKMKRKAQVITKAITVKKAKGSLTYKNFSSAKASKKIKVNAKTGRIIVPKGTKRGTYLVKIKVNAKGDNNHNSGSKTVTVKVRVK